MTNLVVGGVAIDLGADAAQIITEMDKAGRAVSRGAREMRQGLSRWERAFGSAERRAVAFSRRITRSFKGVAKSVAGLTGIGALGGGLAAAGLGALAKASIQAADGLAKAADRAGLTTDAYQTLIFAASQTGVEQNQLNVALEAFGRRMAELRAGFGPLNEGLSRLAPELRDALAATTSQEEALRVFADGIKNAKSQGDRLSIAQAAMTETGRKATLTFLEGAAGLARYEATARRFGLILDEKLLRSAEGANDALDILARTMSVRFSAALLKVAPQIEAISIGLAEQIPILVDAIVEWGRYFGAIAPAETTKLAQVDAAIASLTASVDGLRATEGDFQTEIAAGMRQLAELERRRGEIIDAIQVRQQKGRFSTPPQGDPPSGAGGGGGGGAGDPIPPTILGPPVFRSPTQGPPRPTAGDIETERGRILREQMDARRQQLEDINGAAETFGETMAAGLTPAITAQQSLGEALASTATRLAEMVVQATLFRAIMAGIGTTGGTNETGAPIPGTGILGSIFGSRGTGGGVVPGASYVVGERRPEVFRPSTRGRIEPIPAAGIETGGGRAINIDARGADLGVFSAAMNRIVQLEASVDALASRPQRGAI